MTFRPVISTQSDLERAWRKLMEPLGFAGSSVWLMVIESDGCPVPQLTQIEDCGTVPAPDEMAGLTGILQVLLTEVVPGRRVAFLRSRPGRGGLSADDRAWAAALYAACRDAGAPAEVVHVANDQMLVPVPLDDLSLARPA